MSAPGHRQSPGRLDALANLSNNVRRRRQALGITQASLASRSGLSRRTVSALEAGCASVSLSAADRLSEALSVNLTDLLSCASTTDTQSEGLSGANDQMLAKADWQENVSNRLSEGVSDILDPPHSSTMSTAAKVIGIVGYPEVNGFDIVGPSEVFASARGSDGNSAYRIQVLAVNDEPFPTEAGLTIVPQGRLHDAGDLDTILVPGGAGLRRPEIGGPIAAWLSEKSGRVRRIAAVCTGSYGLAAAGLLEGRKATTHWRFAADLQAKYPRIDVDPDLIYVRDGDIYTSGGISAGIDLALALIEEDLGPKAALAVAREMVVFLKRSGGQHQYSEPLKFQVKSGDRFANLLAWVNGALTEELSVARLAESVCLGPRQFTRAFQKTVGVSPAAYVERLRLDRAAENLSTTTVSVDQAAAQVGYRSADVFRRAFERQFGVPPGEYRRRFSTARLVGAVEGNRAHA